MTWWKAHTGLIALVVLGGATPAGLWAWEGSISPDAQLLSDRHLGGGWSQSGSPEQVAMSSTLVALLSAPVLLSTRCFLTHEVQRVTSNTRPFPVLSMVSRQGLMFGDGRHGDQTAFQ